MIRTLIGNLRRRAYQVPVGGVNHFNELKNIVGLISQYSIFSCLGFHVMRPMLTDFYVH